MFSVSSLWESRNCLLHLRTMLDLQRILEKIQQTKIRCNVSPELRDKERRHPWCSTRQDRGTKESATWLGMRGRDAVRKFDSQGEHFTSIHDRFLRDPVYCDSQLAIG